MATFVDKQLIISKMNSFCQRDYLQFSLLTAAEAGSHVYQNEYNKLANVKHSRELAGKISITDIFRNHWDDFLKFCAERNIPIRSSIIENVDKMIHCKDFANGYLFYECPKCNNFHVQGLSCHSRFCPSCGKKYRDARALEMEKTCINVPHRHITWTIAKDLRKFFKKYRNLLDELFHAVNDVLTYIVQGNSKIAKEENRRLGFISVIHTFGRDIKWNPHIHTLIAECVINKYGQRKEFNYFNYETLRKGFQKQVLDRLDNFLKENGDEKEYQDFKKIKNAIYRNHTDGFYVHAPQTNCKNKNTIKTVVRYVSRYAGHPAISENRIIAYNKEKMTITYVFVPHEDDAIINEEDKQGEIQITEDIFKFFIKLIQHISNEKTHQIRYYGFYSRNNNVDTSRQQKLISWNEYKQNRSKLSWRDKIIASYKYDPIMCNCGSIMELNLDMSYFPGYRDEVT